MWKNGLLLGTIERYEMEGLYILLHIIKGQNETIQISRQKQGIIDLWMKR